MVWFTFTFLLGLPNDQTQDEEKFEGEENYTEIEILKPNFQCHIEYVLYPNQLPNFIDVVAWDNAAKIYIENSTSAIIPAVAGQLRWIHFRVNHKMKLKNEDIPALHQHNIKFKVSLGSTMLGEAAKTDKIKKFFGPKFSPEQHNTIQRQFFQPLSENLESLEAVSLLKNHLTPNQQLYILLDTTIETSENYNKLYKTLTDLTNNYLDEHQLRMETVSYQEPPSLVNVLKQKSETETGKKEKGKNGQPNNGHQENAIEKLEFGITGEEVFSGRKTFENCCKYKSKELPIIYSLGSVKNLLNRIQAQFFNPLEITLNHINYLPVTELSKRGVNKIKFRYLICKEYLAESNLLSLSTKMKLYYTRSILTNSLDKRQLIQFIQTSGLKIEVLGSLSKPKPRENRYTKNASERKTGNSQFSINNSHKEDGVSDLVLLGTLLVDISSILYQPHKLFLKCDLPLSSKTTEQHYSSFDIQQSKLLTPTLTIHVGLWFPLTKIQQAVAMDPYLLNRIFVVLYDINLASPLIKYIQDQTQEYLKPMDHIKNLINLKRPLTKNNPPGLINANSSRRNQMTGFLIHCSEKFFLYLEGPTFGEIQEVWAATSCINPIQGHVLYDSSLIFCDRLYESFAKFGGFLMTSLNGIIENIIQNYHCCKTTKSKDSLKALKCLNLLTNCTSMKAAIQNNLFPDSDNLLSLDLEYGVPVQICEKKKGY